MKVRKRRLDEVRWCIEAHEIPEDVILRHVKLNPLDNVRISGTEGNIDFFGEDISLNPNLTHVFR